MRKPRVSAVVVVLVLVPGGPVDGHAVDDVRYGARQLGLQRSLDGAVSAAVRGRQPWLVTGAGGDVVVRQARVGAGQRRRRAR